MAFWNKQDKAPPAKPLVAIIDDEEDLCRVLSLALADAGYSAASAYDGLAGLDLIRQRRPAAILLDIKMPRMNGYEVLTRLQQDPALAAIPVVILTNLSQEGDFSDDSWARKLGVRHFLSKPFTPDKVTALIAELLAPNA
jgi:CheY-like chemotaxis protein